MNLRRFLRPECIRLELKTRPDPLEGEEPHSVSYLRRIRRSVLEELVELFEASGEVVNPKKLLVELENREKKATTALGEGIAIPHVRTYQARSFVMALARSTPGLPFGSLDGEPTHVFVGMIAPRYDDKLYLKVYRTLAPLLQDASWRKAVMEAEDESQILRLMELVRR